MENFEKQYEDVFQSSRTNRKCDLNLVSTDRDISCNDYVLRFRDTLNDYQIATYPHLVRYAWLLRRFCYRGKRRRKNRQNGIDLDGAFGVFTRTHLGFDHKLITKNIVNKSVMTYMDDFYPDFDVNDPFECEYEYPYEYMNFEMLMLVHLMDERMDLLEHGEDRSMTYNGFMDYVINYTKCYNDKHGVKYDVNLTNICAPYVKVYGEKEIQARNLS